MAPKATLILDPSEVAEDRTELLLHDPSGAFMVATDGPDFGTAEVKQYLAAASLGQIPVDYSTDNRQLSIPLVLASGGVDDFQAAREQLEQKVALYQREGGWLKFESPLGPYFVDVVNASLQHGKGSMPILSDLDPDVVLTLDVVPEVYGLESAIVWGS